MNRLSRQIPASGNPRIVSMPRRKDQISRRRRRAFWVLALLILLLAVWLLPWFRIQTIRWPEQLRYLDVDQLREISGLKPGQHMLTGIGLRPQDWLHLRYGAAERRLLADPTRVPSLHSITLKLRFPGVIVAEIRERIEVAYVAMPGGYVLIDKEGVAIRSVAGASSQIPLLEGLAADKVVLGSPLEVDLQHVMRGAIKLMGAIIEADQDSRASVALLPQVRRIRPMGANTFYLTLVRPADGQELTLSTTADGELGEKIIWLRYLLDQGELNHLPKGVFNLDTGRFAPDAR